MINPGTALFTYIYLNPDQSDSYVLAPVKGLTIQKILNYKHYDDFRSDLFRITIASKAEDTKLYVRISELNERFDTRCSTAYFPAPGSYIRIKDQEARTGSLHSLVTKNG